MRTADVLRLAQPRWRLFAPGLIVGVLGTVSAVALLATSAYLITRAADQPPILYLSIAIVGVRAFALGRATFRYLDRLLSHSAAFRGLAELRVGIFRRLIPLAPDGLAQTRRGDLLSRLVGDVDELQNLPLRVVQPLVTAVVVAVASVIVVWIILPSAGIALAVALALAMLLGTLVNLRLSARADRDLAPQRADFADQTLDFVVGLDVLTAFDALDARLADLARTESRLTRSTLARAAGAGATAAAVSLLSGLATAAALWFGIPAFAAGVAAASAAGARATAGTGVLSIGISGPALAVIVLVPMAVFEIFGAVPLAAGAWRQVRASATRVASAVPDTLPPEIPAEPRVDTLIASVPASIHVPVPIPAPIPVPVPIPDPVPASAAAPTSAARHHEIGSAKFVGTAGPHPQTSPSGIDVGLGGVGVGVGRGGAAEFAEAEARTGARARDEPLLQRVEARRAPAIELRGLGASWPARATGQLRPGQPALRGLELSIPSGARLLVEGPSGSGKTTLAHVLVRFLEYSGSFTIGGVEARTLAPAQVRSMIGLCEQNPYIFDANLRQNLLFARETASDDDLLAVLDRVALLDWALERGGLDARLGERGSLVSGGQAQRIALARMLLADFPVVIFDEPTANVDPDRVERLLVDLLEAAGPERTVILISHTDVPAALVTQRLRLGTVGW
ncbi:amino acid ABC transporter ATP-binding/permease protein [Subtercola vilae]|uniref:ATP-binding cassette domain-containing protein n=1 Tax=Subtercola vilae TaxID=2056433 RepID=A0A4T2BNE8_9MICO|nr:ATP-binding cassette domain-containing protein [Subtercola vilae]TIH30588.1 ATP-binding cassette domain-containing protein [Subtercola vilae]